MTRIDEESRQQGTVSAHKSSLLHPKIQNFSDTMIVYIQRLFKMKSSDLKNQLINIITEVTINFTQQSMFV